MPQRCEASVTVKIEEEVKCDHTEITPEAEAIILYPSFGAPLLVNPDKPLRLFVLFERFLFELYREEVNRNKGKTKIVTPKTIEIINKSLKIFSWDGAKQDPGKNLFGDNGTAESNISIDLIKIMGSISGAGRKVFDKYGKLVGLMRPGTLNRYTRYYYRDDKKKKDRGYFAYLFEIEIRNYKLAEGLHDCAWKMHDPTGAANSMKPTPPFPERQDLIAQRYIENIGSAHVKQSTGYKIIPKDEGKNRFEFENEPSCPLNNRHPIYVSGADKLNVGQLTDIHVSSRQVPLQLCQAQVLPGAGTSPKIGGMVNVSFNTFKNLLDQMGRDKDVDVLALTGDLIDFNQNFNPAAAGTSWKTDFERPAALWQWMNPKLFDDPGQGEKGAPYPIYIDMLTVYSLLHDFVKTHKKPIIMLTGNHEAYDKPYGVSPRLGQFKKIKPEGFMRLNEGIPADHNLTTYEAALLYGPAYGDFRRPWNFLVKYLDWFYMLFTPLSDVTLTYGANQSFTALEWEDEEQYIENMARGASALPRATRAVSSAQLDLLKEAGQRNGRDNVLLTHFTFVSYSYDHKINEAGEVNIADNNNFLTSAADLTKPPTAWSHNPFAAVGHIPGAVLRTAADWTGLGAQMGAFEEGSFLKNREEVYKMLYNGNFTHAFSGHSHRAGFYIMTDCTNKTVKVQGHPIDETKLTTTGKLQGGRARLIVGASGGPLPGQNHYSSLKEKGLSNWTFERPAGNVMNLRDDTLCLKPADLDTAKPRFAVALSFFNDLNEPVFKTFESGTGATQSENKFKIVLHEDLPGEEFIRRLDIYSYQISPKMKSWILYGMAVSGNGTTLTATFAKSEMDDLNEKLVNKDKFKNPYFLSVAFTKNGGPLAGKTGYKQYNYDSPWILPISIQSKQEVEADKVSRSFAAKASRDLRTTLNQYVNKVIGYRIQASKLAPNFKWYRDTFPKDYSSGQDLPKGADASILDTDTPGVT